MPVDLEMFIWGKKRTRYRIVYITLLHVCVYVYVYVCVCVSQ